MKITRETVEYVAHLARLEFDAGEIDQYTEQIDRILEYMDTLNTLDTAGIEPTSHAVPIDCVLREDRERDSFDVPSSTQNAPDKRGSFFKVPPVIEVD